MRRAALLLATLAPLVAASCITRGVGRPVWASSPAVVLLPVEAWSAVTADGAVVGYAVRFTERDGERTFISVRNAYQQELGLVDELGRAWRYRPHEAEPELIGSGPVAESIGRVLGLDRAVALEPVPLDALAPADADADADEAAGA